MKRKKLKEFFLVAIMIVVIAVTSSAWADTLFWPMDVGQIWTYQRSDATLSSWTVTLEVTGKETLGAYEYYHVRQLNYDNQGDLEEWDLRSTSDGLYHWDGSSDQLNFQIGSIGMVIIDGDTRRELVAIESVTVPYGGPYTAYKFENQNTVESSPYWYEYIVPGICWVQQIDYWANTDLGQVAPLELQLVSIDGLIVGSGTVGDPYLIEDLVDFNVFAEPANAATYWASGVYTKLASDIDLSGRTYTSAVIAADMVYSTYNFDGVPFAGKFNGNCHKILNLTIDTGGLDKGFLGLFGMISAGAVVTDLGLEGVSVIGSGNWVNGDFTGDFGALVGNNSGAIQNCWVSGSVTGGVSSEDVGGLCGWNQSTGSISRCYVIGSVTCGTNSGGVGGLCGSNDGSITNSWASSSVTGANSLGGLCGFLDGGSIANSYSVGSVTGTAGDLGGLCGERIGGTIDDCFWNVETSGMTTSNGGIGKTTIEMKQKATFTNWDFTGIWEIVDNQTYPSLKLTYPGGDLVSDHVFALGISQGWDYGEPDVPGDFHYEITFRAQTDETVEQIAFLTPAGNTFQISNLAEQCDENICTSYEYDGVTAYWEYYGAFQDLGDLDNYGDGTYTITFFYNGCAQDQTNLWFGIPSTDEFITQPTQQPVMVFPEHNSVITSPVDFEWLPCTDPYVNLIAIVMEEPDSDEISYEQYFQPFATSWENAMIIAGIWDVDLSFGQRYPYTPNGDGIPVRVSKYSESDYAISNISDTISIQKCTVKAGKRINTDRISFSGILDATADDLDNADGIRVTVDSADMQAAYMATFDVPQSSVKKGKYTSPKVKPLAKTDPKESFKLDTKKGKFTFMAKNIDLTGLSCPVSVEIAIGNYDAEVAMYEAIVNGKKPVPIQFMMGVKDSLYVDKIKARKGKKASTDSLSVKGAFSLKDEPSYITSMTLSLGDQSLNFTDDNGIFTYKKDRKTSEITSVSYKTDKGANPQISAKFDMVKCNYSVSVKKADLAIPPGQTTFGVLIDMSLSDSDYNESVQINLN